MNAYQINFSDGNQMFINANNEQEARAFAEKQANDGATITTVTALK